MEPEKLVEETAQNLREVLSVLSVFNPPTEDVSQTDQTGKVEVTFRPDGTLRSVKVAADWASEIEADQLAVVITEAMGYAQAKVLGFDPDQLAAFEQGGPGAHAPQTEAAYQRSIRDAEDVLLGRRSDAELRELVDNFDSLIDELNSTADAAMEKLSNPDLPQDPAEAEDSEEGQVIQSDNHMVSVRVTRGLIAQVSIREAWLENRSGLAVTESFNQIVERLEDAAAANSTGV